MGRAARRAQLHLVDAVRRPTATPDASRHTERGLVDAWREAHWALRLKLQEVSRHLAGAGIEAACNDEARRCDNLLNEFHRARADVLQRQVRDLRESCSSRGPGHELATRTTFDPHVESSPRAHSH